MTKSAPAAIFLLFVLCGIGAASAQTDQSRANTGAIQQLAAYIRSPDHLATVGAAIANFEPTALAAACKDIKPVKGRSWRPLEDPTFDPGATAPKTAAWQETWNVLACGRPALRSVGFVARPSQGVLPFPMFPGESLADLRLQQDAGQMALDVVAPGSLACAEGQIQVIASTVTNRTYLPRGQWSERWTVAGCGRTADVDVDFTPGPAGRPSYSFRAGKSR